MPAPDDKKSQPPPREPDDKKSQPPPREPDEAKAIAQVEADKKAAADAIERAKAAAEKAERERQRVAAKDKQIAEISRTEDETVKAPEGEYGPFADHPQKFVVTAEMIGGAAGGYPRGKEITYRDLVAYHDKERKNVNVGRTKANADRLVAAGHIKPLVIV